MHDARIFHVNVNCSDLERSRRFYAEAFGLDAAVRTTPDTAQPGTAFGLDPRAGTRGCSSARTASTAARSTCSSGRSRCPVGAPPASFVTTGFQRLGIARARPRRGRGRASVDSGERSGVTSRRTRCANGGHVRLVMGNDPDGTAIELHRGQRPAACRSSRRLFGSRAVARLLPRARLRGGRARFASDAAPTPRTCTFHGPVAFDESRCSRRRAVARCISSSSVSAMPRGRPRAGSRPRTRSACGALALLVGDLDAACAELAALRIETSRRRSRCAMGPGLPVLRFVCFARAGRRSDRAHRTAAVNEFPADFFARQDEAQTTEFYDFPRFVTHIDDAAIAAVGALYEELGSAGRRPRPHELVGVALP